MGSGAGKGLAAAAQATSQDDLKQVLADFRPEDQEKVAAALAAHQTNLKLAAHLLDQDPLTAKALPGLSKALRELAAKTPPPEDATTWLRTRLREERPVADVEYAEPVLPGLVMKCDEFANIHLLKTERPHPEVWNFRKCDADFPVFGVGQCHLNGLAFLLKHMKDDLSFETVKWFNMREEPVVFLDGQACAPRTANNLNENVEYLKSIEGFELDAMERRLCADCAAFTESSESKTIGVYYQTADGGNEERQLKTPPETSVPMRGAYEWLAEQGGAKAEYYRVPIADETAPEEMDFDQLVAELRGVAAQPGVALVFNCQMGRGRTTTGMVCATIMVHASRGFNDKPPARDPAAERNLKRGEFRCILELMALLDKLATDRGAQAKLLADQSIDACAHAQNMVE